MERTWIENTSLKTKSLQVFMKYFIKYVLNIIHIQLISKIQIQIIYISLFHVRENNKNSAQKEEYSLFFTKPIQNDE